MPPTVNFNYATGPYCTGSPIAFTDASSNSPVSWTWSVTPSAGVTITTPTSQNPSITFNSAGIYTVSHQSSNGAGPGAPISKTITINPSPTIITVSNPTAGIICSGNSITLSGSGASTYTWTGGITNAVAFTPTTSGTYSVTGTATTGCQGNSVRSITVNPLPVVTAASNPSTAICLGQSITLTGSGASAYSWTGGITNAVAFTPTASATYSVVGTATNGCQNTATKSVTVNLLPTVSANTSNTLICTGQSVTITASGASTYSWNTSATTSAIVVSPSTTTTYSVIGTSSNTCSNSARAHV